MFKNNILSVIIGLLVFVCDPLSIEASGFISGKVLTNDNQPIPNIFVDAMDLCGGKWYASGKTDSTGNYQITLSAGTYYLQTDTSDAYVDEWWNSGEGATNCADSSPVTVADGQTVSNINFRLNGKGKVCGKITTTDNQPISGVKIDATSLCGETWYGSGSSDEEGNFFIEGLPEGNYYISTYNKDYPAKWWDGTEGTGDCNNAVQVSVVKGQDTCGINFKLGAGKISGRVTTSTGQAIPNIRVEATDLCGGTSYGEGLSDSAGNYVISALLAGDYYISAHDEAKKYTDEWWSSGNGTTDCHQSGKISVVIGQTISDANFILDESAAISGQIATNSGQAIPNIKIQASGLCGETVYGESISDTSGNYSISGLLPGNYFIFAEDENKNYINEWWDNQEGTGDCNKALQITLAKGQTVSADFKLELNRPGDISVTLNSKVGGQPIADISIGVWGLCNNVWYEGCTTDTDGKCTVSVTQGADYYVFAFDESGKYIAEWWNSGDGTTDCNKAEKVAVSSGKTVSLSIPLDEGGKISGNIKASSGEFLSEMEINVLSGTCLCDQGFCRVDPIDIYQADISDSQGNYLISSLPPGNYYAYVTDKTETYPDTWWNGEKGTRDCKEAKMTTLGAGQTFQINLTLDKSGSISGKVAESGGQPLENVCVSVWDSTGSQLIEDGKSDNQGNYLIEGLAAGNYYVSTDASCETPQTYYIDEWWDKVNGTTDFQKSVSVTVSSGQTASDIDFLLDKGGAVSGKIMAETDGQALKNTCVSARGTLCEKADFISLTDENGTYFIPGLPPGTYYIFTDVSCMSPQNYINEWWNNTDDCNKASVVTVVLGQTTGGINFSLKDAPITQKIPVISGWNWLSFNTLPEDTSLTKVLEKYPAQNNDVIKTTGKTATYYNAGWYGFEQSNITPDLMYLFYNQYVVPRNVEVYGYPANVSGGISIAPGWNWIGFKPQQEIDITTALNSLTLSNNDMIKTAPHLGGTATYYSGKWWPSDYKLKPGVGYLLKSSVSDTLFYPKSDDAEIRHSPRYSAKSERSMPKWEYSSAGMQYAMTIYAKIRSYNGRFTETDGSILAAFKNEQCRGVIPITEGPGGKIFQLTVASDTDGEELDLKVYNAGNGKICGIKQQLLFSVSEETVGQIDNPEIYEFEKCEIGISDAVRILKILCGSESSDDVELDSIEDINQDGNMGVEEVIYILKTLSEL